METNTPLVESDYNLVNRFFVEFPNNEFPVDCVYDVSELVILKQKQELAPLLISFVSKKSINIEKRLLELIQNTEESIDVNISMLNSDGGKHIEYVITAKIDRVIFSPFTYADSAAIIHQLVLLPEKVDIA